MVWGPRLGDERLIVLQERQTPFRDSVVSNTFAMPRKK